MIQKPSIYILVLILSLAGEMLLSAEKVGKVNVEIFPGVKSNLLTWEVKEELNTDSIIIFRTTSLRTPFEFVTKVTSTSNRYLDHQLSPKHRYFYKLILNDQSSSDTLTPPFGRPLEMNEETDIILSKIGNHPITNFNILVSKLLEYHIGYSELTVPELDSKILSKLLTENSQETFPWLNHFSVKAIYKIQSLNLQNLLNEILRKTKHDLEVVSPYFSNQFEFTPEEWDRNLTKTMRSLKEQTGYLLQSMETEFNLILSQHPLRISGIRSEKNQPWVDLFLLNDKSNEKMDVWIKGLTEVIQIEIPENSEMGTVISVAIPETWNECSLWINDLHLQTIIIDFTESEKMVITLKNEYVLNSIYDSSFLIPGRTHPIRMNELIFNSETQLLSIELLQKPMVVDPIFIFVNSELVWEYTPMNSMETVIVDSQITVSSSDSEFFWVKVSTQSEETSAYILESIPFYSQMTKNCGRNPDNLIWEETSMTTMGYKNQIQNKTDKTKFIPELFALYQNYPNPFNSETSIKFDLLKQSHVSLYVLNAAGHIEKTYFENEEMTPGHYSFLWQGNSHSSGVYFVTIQAVLEPYMPVVMSRKMIYLK